MPSDIQMAPYNGGGSGAVPYMHGTPSGRGITAQAGVVVLPASSAMPHDDGVVRCVGLNKKGEPCGGHPVHGETVCVGHKRTAGKALVRLLSGV